MKKAICFCIILLSSVYIHAKKLGECIGTLQIEKNPIVISKQAFKDAARQDKTNNNIKKERVLIVVNSQFTSADLSNYGWKQLSRTGNLLVVEGPSETAVYLGALDGVVEIKRPSKLFSTMDSARVFTRIDEVHGARTSNLPSSYTGKNVLVGIIETEFDTHHPAFLDSTGHTRFVAIWDQSDTVGPKPKYGYGTIRNSTQIDADPTFALHGEEVHGTYITGYAAGSKIQNNPYYGAAPEAKIVGVKYSGLDNDIADAVRYIFYIADSLKLPCVINMSIGTQVGPHDGTSLVDSIIDHLSSSGKIIVGAAGNDGDKRAHISFVINKGEKKGTWVTPGVEKNSVDQSKSIVYSGLDIWGKSGVYYTANFYVLDTISMQYLQLQPTVSTSNAIPYKVYKDTLYVPNAVKGTPDTVLFQALVERSSKRNGKVHIQSLLIGSNPNLFFGVNLSNAYATTDSIHAWNTSKLALKSFGISGYYDGDTVMSINEVGGTSKRNITVGAYLNHTDFIGWNGTPFGSFSPSHELTRYSGHGPTVDGRTKPDITAPGSDVVGPLSQLLTINTNTVIWPNTQNTFGRYGTTGGTSVASPIVTGIVALMLQVKPTLTPEEAKLVLQQTAINDIFTGEIATSNNYWGAGKVNALGAIQKLLNLPVTKILSPPIMNNEVFRVLVVKNKIQIFGLNIANNNRTYGALYTLKGALIMKEIIDVNREFVIPKNIKNQVVVFKIIAGVKVYTTAITVRE